MSFVNVFSTLLASSNLFVTSKIPSKAINVSLPQSKNQGNPAIIDFDTNFGLSITKESLVIIKSLIT